MPDDDSREEVRQRYDWQEVPPCIAIVETIERFDASTSGPNGGLTEPLGTYLEVDAIDTLVQNDLPKTLSFEIEEYTVTLTEDAVSVTATGVDAHAGR